MKNLLLSLFIALFFCSINAQPVLQSIPLQKGVTIPFSLGTAHDPGLAGENVNWDFSNEVVNPGGTIIRVEESTNPYRFRYPNCNYVFLTNTGSFSYYDYYTLNNSGFSWVGFHTDSAFIDLNTDPRLLMKFPLNYKDAFIDTAESFNRNIYYGIDTFIYDAYGSLTTPHGYYPNTIRIKAISNNVEIYYWYVADSKFFTYPVYQLNIINNTVQVLNYNIPVSVDELDKSHTIQLYPNPASTNLSIRDLNADGIITITDIQGKILIQQGITATNNTITVDALATGMYFYQLTTPKGQQIKTGKLIVAQ